MEREGKKVKTENYQKAALGLQVSYIFMILLKLTQKMLMVRTSVAAMFGHGGLSTGQDGAPVALDKLALAKQLASKININAVAGGKGGQTQVATEAFRKGGDGAGC